MPKAILKNGLILPLEPLPPDWLDGQELELKPLRRRKLSKKELERRDQWFKEVEESAAQIDPEADKLFAEAIARIRKEAKEQARRRMRSA